VLFGFEPFGDEPVNPSGVAVQALHGRQFHGVRVESVVLPVVYDAAFPLLQRVLEAGMPRAVMGVGQGKDNFRIETLARNHVGERPDNGGAPRAVSVVDANAPEHVATSWRADLVLRAVAAAAGTVPVGMSDNAGDFLCNHTLFRLLSFLDGQTPAGFLHVPRLSVVTQGVINQCVEAAVSALNPLHPTRPAQRIS